jgi:hypothetical protein
VGITDPCYAITVPAGDICGKAAKPHPANHRKNESGRIMVFIKANRAGNSALADFNAANGGVLNGAIQSL